MVSTAAATVRAVTAVTSKSRRSIAAPVSRVVTRMVIGSAGSGARSIGSAGVFRLPGIDPTRGGAVVPSVTVAAGATYELLGVAQEPVADGTAAQSIVLRRGATDPTTLAAGTWLEPPTGLASDRTMVSFVRGAATGPYAVQLDNAGLGVEGRRVMTIAILDGSSTVALPLDRAPLPADPLTMRVTTLDTGAAIDLRDFEVTAVTAQTVAAAVDTIKIP